MQTFYPSILFGSPPTQCPLFLLFHLQRLDLQPPHLIYAGINQAGLSHLINAGKTRSLSSTVAAVDSPVPPILGSGHLHQMVPYLTSQVVDRPLGVGERVWRAGGGGERQVGLASRHLVPTPARCRGMQGM